MLQHGPGKRKGLIPISGCEVCGRVELHDVLDLGDHPMCDDLIAIGDPRRSDFFPISIAFCEHCKTAHQNYQIPKHRLFPTTYHYRSRHTADVLNGMQQLVARCEAQLGSLAGLKVLDIGCNDGSLLSFFARHGAKTYGIEPTDAGQDAGAAGHQVHQGFLEPALARDFVASNGQPDIVTFTNVFAHIENLKEVLAAVRHLMSPHTLLVIENHYLGSVLDSYQFDTFYHEHPRTYSFASFTHIAEALGAKIVACEFPARYGGNIRVMMQIEPPAKVFLSDVQENDFAERLGDMARRIPVWSAVKRASLEQTVARHGPLPAKAFPGRAAILVKLLRLDEDMVSAVYEKPGSMKVGHYVPGTRIPILSDDEFTQRPSKEAPLLNLAWHIAAEIHGYLRRQGFKGEIIDIFSRAEFDSAL